MRNLKGLFTARKSFCLGAALALGTLASPQAMALTKVSSFGSNPGNIAMYKYVPSGLASGRPLVVALHGCTQSAASYDSETGWTKFADRDKFALLLPEQNSGNNGNKCWNWFEPGDITRGQGEALSIKQMVDKMKADHGIDPNKVYVTGLSAGGAMTTVMIATYPDVFRGGAVVAGIPYKCATTMNAGFSCMSGVDKTPQQWGDLARGGYSGYSGVKPKVSIWHGDADYTVQIKNAQEIMEQWTNYHGTDQTADLLQNVHGHERKVYNAGSNPVVEWYTIKGMAHGTPIDPGSLQHQCGSTAQYILDANICSSYYIGRFFGIVAESADGDGDNGTGGGGGGGGDTSSCWTATNSSHAGAGRANAYGSAYYAKGSWQYMGYGGSIVTSLKLTKANYYEIVPGC